MESTNSSPLWYSSYFVSNFNEENFRKVAEVLVSKRLGVFTTKNVAWNCDLTRYKIIHMMPIFLKAGMVDVFSSTERKSGNSPYAKEGCKYYRTIRYRNLVYGKNVDEVMDVVRNVSKEFDEKRWKK